MPRTKKPKKKIIKKDSISSKFGTSPRIKIMEFLINNRQEAWGIREIIKYARVKHRNTVDEVKDLLSKDMIYIDKTLGRSHLYKANELDKFVQSLIFAMGQEISE